MGRSNSLSSLIHLVGPILTLYARMPPLQKTIGEGVVCASDVLNRLGGSKRFKHITCAYRPLCNSFLEGAHMPRWDGIEEYY